MRIIILILIAIFCRCSSSNKPAPSQIHIRIDSLQLDSVGIRLLHYMDGRELMDTLVAVNKGVRLSGLKEDMYLLAFYWPSTFVPHQTYKNRLFNKEEGETYVLTKAFYIHPGETDEYRFFLDSAYTVEDIEIGQIRRLNLDTELCNSCRIAEQYWSNYNDFFVRKDSLVITLSHAYYQTMDIQDPHALAKYRYIDSVKNSMWTDSVYRVGFDQLVKTYPNSRASTFFVFYQLYTNRYPEKYRDNFMQLRDEARHSRYYPMLARQYENH